MHCTVCLCAMILNLHQVVDMNVPSHTSVRITAFYNLKHYSLLRSYISYSYVHTNYTEVSMPCNYSFVLQLHFAHLMNTRMLDSCLIGFYQ